MKIRAEFTTEQFRALTRVLNLLDVQTHEAAGLTGVLADFQSALAETPLFEDKTRSMVFIM